MLGLSSAHLFRVAAWTIISVCLFDAVLVTRFSLRFTARSLKKAPLMRPCSRQSLVLKPLISPSRPRMRGKAVEPRIVMEMASFAIQRSLLLAIITLFFSRPSRINDEWTSVLG